MKLRHSILVDYSREVNLARRRHATKRQVAWFCVILAMVLVAISFGCMIDLVCNPYFSALAVNIMVAGIWGGYFLLTRHH